MELLQVWLVAAGLAAALVYGFMVFCVLVAPIMGPAVQALGCLGPVAGIPVFAVALAAALGAVGAGHPILVALLTTPLAVITGALTLKLEDLPGWEVMAIPLAAVAIGVETVLVTLLVSGIASAISHVLS